ncbi:molybdopterin-containing oxidoreductase family protein, partial [Ellagibacter isourolithinifaciens]|uniref:molybdopterin-containing oxidoreductase family protein n=1 Tax=Ellagibacter isourolithinifaciens TaxID=2137581 RepID=UPI003AAEE7EB
QAFERRHLPREFRNNNPGKGYFVQISWEEALDTIADKMKEIKAKYGPYGIFHSQYPSFEKNGFPLAAWWEAGFGAWGEHSTSGHAAGEMLHLGVDLTKVASGRSDASPGFEASDIFNSKLFIMWGMDPVVAWFGPTSYYMQLAHEYGCKTIVIDPRYTQSAEILADQWIPIRPGTDLAMMLAIAQVLYEEDLIDHKFVDEWVDKAGFEEWRAYVMGEGEDGIKKTPEWAAPICAVPAETIREFARLYGTTKPVHLQYFYSCAKRHMGDYSAIASMLLQSMTGNIACPGGCETGACLPTPGRVPAPRADWHRDPGNYKPPVLFNNNCLTEILACQKDYWEGRMSESEFRHRIGSPTNDSPLPNIQMIIFENNYGNNHSNVNKRFAGMASTEFNWGFQWHLNQPTAELCDIILPAPIWQLEGMDEYMYGHQRFVSGPNGMRNYFTFCGRGLDFPGEVRSKEWVWTEIAKRLGVADKYNPRMLDVDVDHWVDAQEAVYKEAFENWANNETIMAYLGYEKRPTWEEFNAHPVIRTEIDSPYYPFRTRIERGESPFETPSGKIEFSSNYVKTHDMTESRWRGQIEPMPVWSPSYVEGDIGSASNDGFYNPKVKKYPLSMVSPVSIYRQHSSNDNNPFMREDCYRHAVWISGVDAQARGIKDGDICRVYSDRGEVELTAYVTNRMMPGTAAVHHGAWFQTDGTPAECNTFGEDLRGTPNILLDDGHLPHILGALITAGLVEVEKLRDGDAEGFGNEAERGGMRGASVALNYRRSLGEGKE